MDRIDRIAGRPPQWQPVALDPDRDEIAERRRRREQERRREQRRDEQPPRGDDDGDPPHHVDVRV